ncbi:MAG: M14 family metallopeptidase [Chitinophagaceae bacterium]
MKKNIVFILLLLTTIYPVFGQKMTTLFEQSNGQQTPTYFEIVKWWKKLDAQSAKVNMLTMGPTDAGYPLHLILVSNGGDKDFKKIHQRHKKIILINNGIHPGEPDGIDASMLLARDIVENRYKIPDDVVLAIIPVYNIGGCLNRSTNYRVDQNGPEAFGFRGNGQNLDLNRDFIKSDSKNARSFAAIFQLADPDVFVDNHVSDGADYQHVMTLICTQHDKLGGALGEFMNKEFEPGLYSLMKTKGYDLVPYVNDFDESPEKSGWSEFFDSPRYSSGYAALWQCFSFIPETHMLKPYKQRVKATLDLLQSFIEFTAKNGHKIQQLRAEARNEVQTQTNFPIHWKMDTAGYKEITYKGYKATHKPSEISGLPRLFYDRTKPFEANVKLYNSFPADLFVKKPVAYIIPQGWWKVVDLLKLNRVKMKQLLYDTTIKVDVYTLDHYKSSPGQFEMHHPNSNVTVATHTKEVQFRKGDWYIPMNQTANRFIVETLEPEATDSYFAWNFFDAILGLKEGFSPYHFEDIAAAYLKNNPALKSKLDEKKSTDKDFANNANAQLFFIFQHSPWIEPTYNQYPVYRVMQ